MTSSPHKPDSTTPVRRDDSISRSTIVLCVLGTIVGACGMVWVPSYERFDNDSLALLHLFPFLIAVPAGLLARSIEFREPDTAVGRLRVSDYAIAGSGGLVVALVVAYFGRLHFPGYDGSVFAELAWRTMQGMRPYEDFFCPFPPLYVWGDTTAFRIFGVEWVSLAKMCAVLAAVTFPWTYCLIRTLGLKAWVSVLIALQIQASTTIFCGVWMYNVLTNLFEAVLFLAFVSYAIRPRSIPRAVSLAAALALLMLCKPNALLLAVAIMVLAVAADFVRGILVSVISLLGAVSAMLLWGISVSSVLAAYQQVAKARGNPFHLGLLAGHSAVDLAILGALIMATGVFAATSDWRETRRSKAVCLAALVCVVGMCILQLLMNVDWVYIDMTAAATAVVLLVLLQSTIRPEWRSQTKRTATAVAMALAIYWVCVGVKGGAERVWIWSSMPDAFFETCYSSEPSATAFLRSAPVGPRLVKLQDEIADVLSKNCQARVFFGPRIEFAYLAFQVPSPRGLPVWWHPGTSYPMDHTPAVVEAWKRNNFDLLVFLKRDFTRIPTPLCDDILKRYKVDDRYENLTLFVRKEYTAQRAH